LKGRRESEDNEHLTFDDAIKEFKDIIRLSDQATKGVVDVKKKIDRRGSTGGQSELRWIHD
jgi:separase